MPPLPLAKILNVALPFFGEARAVVDVLACQERAPPAAGDVAPFVGTPHAPPGCPDSATRSLPALKSSPVGRACFTGSCSRADGASLLALGRASPTSSRHVLSLVRRLMDNRGPLYARRHCRAAILRFRAIWKDSGVHELALRPYVQAAAQRQMSFVRSQATPRTRRRHSPRFRSVGRRAPAIEPPPPHVSRGSPGSTAANRRVPIRRLRHARRNRLADTQRTRPCSTRTARATQRDERHSRPASRRRESFSHHPGPRLGPNQFTKDRRRVRLVWGRRTGSIAMEGIRSRGGCFPPRWCTPLRHTNSTACVSVRCPTTAPRRPVSRPSSGLHELAVHPAGNRVYVPTWKAAYPRTGCTQPRDAPIHELGGQPARHRPLARRVAAV